MASTINFEEPLSGIYFAALKSRSYHSLRMDVLDARHRWIMFIVVLMSSSSLMYFAAWFLGIIDVDPQNVNLTALFSFLTLIVGTSDIAFGWIAQSRRHDTLSNRWGDLVRRIDEKNSEGKAIKERDYALFVKEHNLIIKDEPLIYMGLDAVAYNFASRSYGHNQVLIIPWQVRLFKNWYKFSNKQFTLKELPEQRVEKAEKSKPKGK